MSRFIGNRLHHGLRIGIARLTFTTAFTAITTTLTAFGTVTAFRAILAIALGLLCGGLGVELFVEIQRCISHLGLAIVTALIALATFTATAVAALGTVLALLLLWAVIALLLVWAMPWHALGVAALVLGQLQLMRKFVAAPVAKALQLSAFGVPLLVTGMMIAAFALRRMGE